MACSFCLRGLKRGACSLNSTRILRRLGSIWLLSVVFLGACTLNNPSRSSAQLLEDWQSGLGRDHPLVGKIWWQKEQRFVSPQELVSELSRHNLVLLGEKHDNPDHHGIERWLVQKLAEGGGIKSVYFEMLAMDQRDSLVRLNASHDSAELGLAELKAQLGWPAKGWRWEDYGAIIQQAFQLGLKVWPANVSREALAELYKNDEWVARNAPKGEPVTLGLYRQIHVSHCLMLKEAQIYPMIAAQKHRDQTMARQLNRERQKRLLVAGNFHVRRDFGVPNYLDGSDSFVNLAILEVEGSRAPSDYNPPGEGYVAENIAAEGPLGGAGIASLSLKPFDFIWFTPRWTDRDYCKDLM